MAGHPLVNQVKAKSDMVAIGDKLYNVHLSYHRIAGVEGLVVGLKFSDENGSMDSAKRGITNPFGLGTAIANKAVQMLRPDLNNVTILAFYLLTEDLDARRAGAGAAKGTFYAAQAVKIHRQIKPRLPHLTSFEVQGGLGWAMSVDDFGSYEQFKVFENELAKQLRVIPC